MITEDYVSFETAKLLKEKGFDEPCKVWYSEYTSQFNGKKYNSLEFDDCNRFNVGYKFLFYVPTLQMAMKWLREVHKIGIFTSSWLVTNAGRTFERHPYGTSIVSLVGEHDLLCNDILEKETYEEAVEAALKYCLNHLIDVKTT